jgi:hypothetical protein
MTFKLTYTDGQETDYDDGTAWEVDDGVLKMGRKDGDWTVLVSPSHWAVIEVGGADETASDDGNDDRDAGDTGPDDSAKNEDKKNEHEKSEAKNGDG